MWDVLLALKEARRDLVVVAIIGFLLVLYWVARMIEEEIKIRRLGGHASVRKSLDPTGIGFVLLAVRLNMQNRDYSVWMKHLFYWANPNHPYTVELRILGQRTIFTADDENIKAILATQFSDFGKGPRFHKDWKDLLGDSIFTTDGSLWHSSRALIRPQFIKDRVSDLRVFEKHLQVLLPQMKSSSAGGGVNLSQLLFHFTLDSATDFLLGESVNSLVNPLNTFAEAFGEVQRVQSQIARAGPANAFVPRRSFFAGLKVIDNFVEPYIEQTLNLTPQQIEEKTKSDEGYTFLHALAAYTRDRKMLRDQLVAVLLAARDTTAVTLGWLFYTLARQPEEYRRLRAEILSHVGRHREPSYADLKNMRYLQHTLNEILRLYPAVPYNVRVALKDTSLPHGGGPDGKQPIGVLEGQAVGYSTLALHRRADIYPPVSEKFPPPDIYAPSRWEHWTPKSWTYIPFNGGPRICVGQSFALTEMGYTVVRILQRYARMESRMTETPKEKAEIVSQPSIPVTVAFFEED